MKRKSKSPKWEGIIKGIKIIKIFKNGKAIIEYPPS